MKANYMCRSPNWNSFSWNSAWLCSWFWIWMVSFICPLARDVTLFDINCCSTLFCNQACYIISCTYIWFRVHHIFQNTPDSLYSIVVFFVWNCNYVFIIVLDLVVCILGKSVKLRMIADYWIKFFLYPPTSDPLYYILEFFFSNIASLMSLVKNESKRKSKWNEILVWKSSVIMNL